MAGILAALHSPAERLGALEPPIAAAGHAVETRVMPGPLPSTLAGYGGLIVMGGTMGAYEADRYPFLTDEIRLLREALAAGLPALGVCLGSQLLAAAGGARVYRGTAGVEGGWHPGTRHAVDSLLAGWAAAFRPPPLHGGTVGPPPGGTLLPPARPFPPPALPRGPRPG